MARRKKWVSWIPAALLGVLILAFVGFAITMSQSWWTTPDAAPSVDQTARDGMTTFTTAGVDYATKEAIVRIRLTDAALPASELGLAAEGVTTIEPIVPVQVLLLGDDTVVGWELADSIVLTTSNDQLVGVELRSYSITNYTGALATMHGLADGAGWTDADFDALTEELTAASRANPGEAYTASLVSTEPGFTLTATIEVRPGDAAGLVLTAARP